MTKVLDQPAKKVFIKELTKGRPSTESSLVWIQGVVTETRDNQDIVFVDDGTAVARIKGCKKLPFTSEIPKQGNYAMFIGLQVSSEECPEIKAMKIQHINHHVVMETMWPLEVIDQALQLKR